MEYKKYFMECSSADTIQRNRNGLYWSILIAMTVLITVAVSLGASWVLTLTLLAVILTLYGPLFLFQRGEQFKRDAEEKTMSFSERGREVFCKEARISTHWQWFDRVGERELQFFLHAGDQIEAIPKRVFDESELETFRKWIAVIDDSPAIGESSLYSELLLQGSPDFQFDFEHQDLLDATSEPLEPVSVTPINEIQMGRHPLGDHAFVAAVLVFSVGVLSHWCYLNFKVTGFDVLICGAGIVFWLYGLSFLSKKFPFHPSEEETAKLFPFKDKAIFVKPDGFGAGLPQVFEFHGWRDVAGVWENSHCLQVGASRGAHLIPKRLFQSEIESKEFLRRLIAIREEGRSQPKHGTVNTTNPYQPPAATGGSLELRNPRSSPFSIGSEMVFLFAGGLLLFLLGAFLIWACVNAEPRYSILQLVGCVVVAALVMLSGGLLLNFLRKGVTLWRHRNDQYRIDETTFWLNGQAFTLNELRVRIKKTLQLAYIVNGENILTVFDTQCPVRKKILSLIPNEKTDG